MRKVISIILRYRGHWRRRRYSAKWVKNVFNGDWGLGFAQKPPVDMTCFYRQYLGQTPKSRQLQGGCWDSRKQIEKA